LGVLRQCSTPQKGLLTFSQRLALADAAITKQVIIHLTQIEALMPPIWPDAEDR
jgi:hypothetical protein